MKFNNKRFTALCRYLNACGKKYIPLYSGTKGDHDTRPVISLSVIMGKPDEKLACTALLLGVDTASFTFKLTGNVWFDACYGPKEFPFNIPEAAEVKEAFLDEVIGVMEEAATEQAREQYEALQEKHKREAIETLKEKAVMELEEDQV